MAMKLTISAAVSGALLLASRLVDLIPAKGRGFGDDLVDALSWALSELGAAGKPDSDGGRVLTGSEAIRIVRGLVTRLEIVEAALERAGIVADEDDGA
jgi:hypothetical protein